MDIESIHASLDVVPKWAYQWCNVFLIVAVLSVAMGFFGILYGSKQSNGTIIVYLFSTVLQAITAMTLYWMCRSSLRNN